MNNSRFVKFLNLDKNRRAVLLEAAWTLAATRAAIRLLPFRWIAPRLGHPGEAPPDKPSTPNQTGQAHEVGWAIRTLAPYLPGDAKCLAQAVAGKWMLQRRGLTSTLYLGVDRGQNNWLEAHAWLQFGPEILTGEPQHERFNVIAAFTED